MASESNNKPLKTMKDKLSSLAGFGDTRKGEKGLPPKTHFSIWYFVLAILFFSYLQPLFFSAQRADVQPRQVRGFFCSSPGDGSGAWVLSQPRLAADEMLQGAQFRRAQ